MAGSGGAWKVAYADFVTAMMALFMVLWISAQDKEILIATSQYFQNPFRSPMDATSGVMPFNQNKTSQSSGKEQGDQKEQSDRNKQIQMTFLNSVAADFYRLLHLDQDLSQKPIDIQVTTDGLRVTLFDRPKRPLFIDNSAEITEWGVFVLQNMAWTIERHRFSVTVDGHTRVLREAPPDYSAFALAAARAEAARKLLVHYAVDPQQIERLTTYGDTVPLAGEPPESESNHRVTLNLTLTVKRGFKDSKYVDQPVPVLTVEKPTP